MSEELNELEELKNEANALGVSYSSKIGAAKLKEKIEDHYKSQETSGPAVEALAEKVEVTETKSGTAKGSTRKSRAMAKFVEAKKTRIVTIVDNDQRSNNHTTTCSVNCSNEFFDLGTRILPLNEKIEVAQGHINVLKRAEIILHSRDNKTGLSVAKSRKRYSVSYED